MYDELAPGELPSQARQERPKVLVDGSMIGRIVMVPDLRVELDRRGALLQCIDQFVIHSRVREGLRAALTQDDRVADPVRIRRRRVGQQRKHRPRDRPLGGLAKWSRAMGPLKGIATGGEPGHEDHVGAARGSPFYMSVHSLPSI